MGTLSVDQSSSVPQPEHGTTINGNVKTDPSPLVSGVVLRTSTRKTSSFSSVSSSPDSPLDDPFKDVEEELKSISSNASSAEHDRVIELGSVNGENSISGHCTPKNESSDSGSPLPVSRPAVTGDVSGSSSGNRSATESPPSQVMQRSSDERYRIPSSVFARTKSTNPMEWSVASNESLFSIHMGNSSFSRDQLLWPSGELAQLGLRADVSPSGQTSNYSANQSPASQTPESKFGELRVETPIETKNGVVRENEDQNNDKSIAEGRISHISEESGNSTKSFAFPILAGDVDQGPSARVGSDMKQQKLDADPNQSSQPETKAAEATQQASYVKWFSCFPCCSLCSK